MFFAGYMVGKALGLIGDDRLFVFASIGIHPYY